MKPYLFTASTIAVTAAAGCVATSPNTAPSDPPATIHALHADAPVNIDGRLDDAVWQSAPAYAFGLSHDKAAQDNPLVDQGIVQLAHDDEYLYVAFSFEDQDVVAEGTEDQLHHYQLGDLAEVFIKPRNFSGYWELYVTPRGNKTAFFFPGRGRLGLPSHFETVAIDIDVAAEVDGTLNEWQDQDTGWTGEMRIRKTDLSSKGVPFTSDQPWSIFFGRYNYSRYLSEKELSMSPTLSKTSYHLTEEYGTLVLDPPTTSR